MEALIKFPSTKLLFNIYSSFVDPTNSFVLIKYITWAIIIIQFCAVIFIFILYILILSIFKKSEEVFQEKVFKKHVNTFFIVQMVIVTGSNILCWIPSGTIYLASTFLDKYPISMVIWTAVTITPINSIINPVVFIITTMRKK